MYESYIVCTNCKVHICKYTYLYVYLIKALTKKYGENTPQKDLFDALGIEKTCCRSKLMCLEYDPYKF